MLIVGLFSYSIRVPTPMIRRTVVSEVYFSPLLHHPLSAAPCLHLSPIVSRWPLLLRADFFVFRMQVSSDGIRHWSEARGKALQNIVVDDDDADDDDDVRNALERKRHERAVGAARLEELFNYASLQDDDDSDDDDEPLALAIAGDVHPARLPVRVAGYAGDEEFFTAPMYKLYREGPDGMIDKRQVTECCCGACDSGTQSLANVFFLRGTAVLRPLIHRLFASRVVQVSEWIPCIRRITSAVMAHVRDDCAVSFHALCSNSSFFSPSHLWSS